MYSDIVLDLTPADEYVLLNDRALYKPFLIEIEKYISSKKIMFGGTCGLHLLTGGAMTRDFYQWEVYTDNAFAVAKEIADLIANVKSPHLPIETISLQTNLKNKEFTLSIYARQILKIHFIERFRGKELFDVLNPPRVPGWFGNTVCVMPPEIQLIEIYRSLYSPHAIDKWEDSIEQEEILFSAWTYKVEGGKDQSYRSISNLLLRKLPGVIIGDYAYSDKPMRLQIISDSPIEDLHKTVARLLPSEQVTYTKYSLNIPVDFQLTKHSIYVNDEAICDVFNSTEYEMIPFTVRDNVKYAGWAVVMRFIMIDIWVLRLMDSLLSGKLSGRINQLKAAAAQLRKQRPEFDKLFQMDNYEGRFIDEKIAKKKLYKQQYRMPNYMPAKKVEK